MDINTRIELNNGTRIPQLGLGTWRLRDGDEVINAVLCALEAGYRHIDTAAFYGNEKGVGRALKNGNIPRGDIFVTTKIWNSDQQNHCQMQAFEDSMERLQLDYVDLYLIHWPVPNIYKETWKIMEQIYKTGRVKAIGVSNFRVSHLKDLLSDCEIIPAVNQMEFNPLMQDYDIYNLCREKGIAFEAWSPTGRGIHLDDPVFLKMASKHKKTVTQVILRWILQKNVIVFPKSANKRHIIENADIYDFELDENDVAVIDAMNKNLRTGPDPDSFAM